MSTLQGTDFFPVGRGFNPYRVSYADVIAGIPSATTGVRGLAQLAGGAAINAGTAGLVVDAQALKLSRTFQLAGKPGAVQRDLHDKTSDIKSVKDFGAKGDGRTDDTAAVLAGVATCNSIYFPAGTYLIRQPALIHRTNVCVFGAGSGVTVVRLAADADSSLSVFDIRTSRANGGAGGDIADIIIRDLTIDCSKSNNTQAAGNGITVLVDSPHKITRLQILDVNVVNSRNAGILLSGLMNGADDVNRVDLVKIQGCSIGECNGVGISQAKVSNSQIINCSFVGNGLEGLTVDLYSYACIISSNRFLSSKGGSGIIGIDSGDLAIISNNYIDGLGSAAPAGYRNGIAFNSLLGGGHGNTETIVIGNIVRNCADNGIIVRDDRGSTRGPLGGFPLAGDKGGDAVIASNQLLGNGTDIRVQDSSGPVIVQGNRMQSIVVTDPDASDVRMGAGDIVFSAGINTQQTIAMTPADQGWKKIELKPDDFKGRLATLDTGSIVLPCSGFYQFNTAVRLIGLAALNVGWLSVGLGHTPPGGVEVMFGFHNVSKNPGAGSTIDDLSELSFPSAGFLPAGRVSIYLRGLIAVAGNIIVDVPVTRVTGFSV